MKIILKEKELAEEILRKKELWKNSKELYSTMNLLARYWFCEGYREDIIKDRLEKYIKEVNSRFNFDKYEEAIDNCIKQNTKENIKLNNVECISITKAELEYIRKIDNIVLERLAFSLLVYSKINIIINPQSNYWINIEDNEIFRDANIAGNIERKYGYIHKLQEIGAIRRAVKVDSRNIRVEFVDEKSEVLLVISDFREFALEYLKWRGDNVGNCEECGCRIKMTNNNSKYCKECSKDVWRKYNAEKQKQYYNEKKHNKNCDSV